MADDLDTFLQPLPDDRREAVLTWLNGSLGDCPRCEQPVLVRDSHRIIKAGIAHTRCAPDAG